VTTCTTNTDQANQPKNKKQQVEHSLKRSCAKQTTHNYKQNKKNHKKQPICKTNTTKQHQKHTNTTQTKKATFI